MKQLKRFVCVLLPILFFSVPPVVYADVHEIISEGTYNMGDGETLSVAESRAILNAKRIALEQAGTFVQTYSKVRNLELAEDEIQVLAAGIMEVTVLEKKRAIVGDGISICVKIKAKIKTDKLGELKKRLGEKKITENYKRVLAAYEKSQTEIEQLKRKLAKTKSGKKRKKIEKKIADDERLFQAAQWFDKGCHHGLNQEYSEALEAFTSAIALDPSNPDAYLWRGMTYNDAGKCDQAIKDCDQAISRGLKAPYVAWAYMCRGSSCYMKGQHERAINDFGKAITIDPGLALAYRQRGAVFFDQGQQENALEDLHLAIILAPEDAGSFYLRGKLYAKRGLFDEAIADYDQAIKFSSDNENLLRLAYCERGSAHMFGSNYERAINDLKKAISLDQQNAKAHMFLGFTYYYKNYEKREFSMALSCLSRAIDLDRNSPAMAKAYHTRAHIYADRVSKTGSRSDLDAHLRDLQKGCDLGLEDCCKALDRSMKILREQNTR